MIEVKSIFKIFLLNVVLFLLVLNIIAGNTLSNLVHNPETSKNKIHFLYGSFLLSFFLYMPTLFTSIFLLSNLTGTKKYILLI